MKQILFLILFVLPFFIHAQTKAMDSSAEKSEVNFENPDVLSEFPGGIVS